VYNSVKKTGKCLVVQEDTLFGGVASDISAFVMEHCFEYLDAPVKRIGSLETPVPFARQLEDMFLPKGRILEGLRQLLAY
jgi:2-oxoisovalerate dehydrogenase E1 component